MVPQPFFLAHHIARLDGAKYNIVCLKRQFSQMPNTIKLTPAWSVKVIESRSTSHDRAKRATEATSVLVNLCRMGADNLQISR